MENTYREILIDTVRTLENTLDELSSNMINLAMTGEFSDVNDRFEVGETMLLSMEDFRNTDDQNLKICFKLFDKIEQSYVSFMNINAIKRKETEEKNTNEDYPFK